MITEQVRANNLHSIVNTTSSVAWTLTLAGLGLVLLLDFIFAFRNRHKATSLRNVAWWTLFYVAAAVAFGATLGLWSTTQARTEFFAGWLTEYSLSFDNLFVLILIMASLKVAKEREEIVLFAGIASSLLLRGLFIAGGAALINRFEWIFYIFGGFLIYTAVTLFRESEKEEWREGRIIRLMRRRGFSLSLIALIAVALTNLIFAFDSIPAIFGLTHNPYVIVTATIFASMGLRQLYFLIGDLMSKLIYLSEGLAVVLGFIGIKLVFEAALGEGHTRIWGVAVPNISLGTSLAVVISVLALTTIFSVLKSRKQVRPK
jgi:tellurite resistance protein TerC